MQSGSRAAPASTRRPDLKPSSKTEDLSTTEQARLYQRANETLITQTVYLERSLDTAKDLRDKLDPSVQGLAPTRDELDSIPRITSGFCGDSVVPASGSTDYTAALRCLDEYREIRVQELQELRASVVQNDDSIARLRGGLSSSKSKSGTSNRAPVFQANIKARVFPKIPTFQDLSAESYPELVKQGVLPDLQRQTQADEFAKRIMDPPDCKKFVKTTDALVDPDEPNSGTFHQIVLDQNGNPQLDDKACRLATEVYKKMQDLRRDPNGQLNKGNAYRPLANRIFAAHKALTGKTAPKTLSQAIGDGHDGKAQKCDDLETGPRRDYCFARNYVVMFFNGEAPSQKRQARQQQQQLNNAAARTPAARNFSASDTEAYELKAGKASPDGKNETDHLYMDPSVIDNVIESQYR